MQVAVEQLVLNIQPVTMPTSDVSLVQILKLAAPLPLLGLTPCIQEGLML
jgi:hypothetical protein